MTPILFIDRDGTLIEEPTDYQIDACDKLRFVAGVIPALLRLRDAGYQFVIVSNQDGLGTERFPRAAFDGPHRLMLQVDRKSTRALQSLMRTSYAVFCLKNKKAKRQTDNNTSQIHSRL